MIFMEIRIKLGEKVEKIKEKPKRIGFFRHLPIRIGLKSKKIIDFIIKSPKEEEKLITLEEKSRLDDIIEEKKAPIGIGVHDAGESKDEKTKMLDWLSTTTGFIEGFTNTDIGSGLESTQLYEYQKKFLNDPSRLRISLKSRQTGFSYVFAAEGMAKCMLKSSHTGIFVSYNEDEAKEKIRYAKALYESMPLRWRNSRMLVTDNKTSLEWEPKRGGMTTRLLSHPQRDVRGKGGSVDVYLDELAHYIYGSKIFLSAMPVIIRGGGVLTCGSSPLGKIGTFFDIWDNTDGKYAGFSKHYVPWWLCLTKGTPISTKYGFKNIEDIKEGNYVLTHNGNYKKVLNVKKTINTKKILGVKSWYNQTFTKITEDHKFLIVERNNKIRKGNIINYHKKQNKKWVEAKNLKRGDYLLYPIPKIKEKNIKYFKISEYINCEYSIYNKKYICSKKHNQKLNITKRKPKILLNNVVKNINAFLKVCGYWIAEGWVYNQKGLNCVHFSFDYNYREKEYIKDLVNNIKLAFGINVKYSYETGFVIIYNKILANLFYNLFGTGAKNKKIPKWILLLPAKKLLKTLVTTYWNGDGTFSDNMWGCSSASKILIFQIRDIFIRNKIPVSFNDYKGEKEFIIRGKKYKNSKQYCLEVFDGKSKMCFFNDEYFYMPVREIKEIKDYNCKYVYDINVDCDESMVANFHIVHNCPLFCKDILKASLKAPAMITEERVRKFGTTDLLIQFENMGLEEFQQEFECEFVDDNISFYPISLIMNCVPVDVNGKLNYPYAGDDINKLHLHLHNNRIKRRLLAGYDVGRKKDTGELVIIDEDLDTKEQRLIYKRTFREMKFRQQKEELIRHLNDLPIRRLGIDKTGLGFNIAEDLEDEFPGRVEGIPFSNEWKEEQSNQFLIRLQDKLIALPDDRTLISHIHSIKRTITAHGHMRYDTEKNAKHHADQLWALILACSMGEELKRHNISTEIIKLAEEIEGSKTTKRKLPSDFKRFLNDGKVITTSNYDPYDNLTISDLDNIFSLPTHSVNSIF